MTIRLNKINSVNFIESGSSTAANSSADLRITNASNGSTYMTISTAGNVGIGTTGPSQKLHVTSSSNNFIRIESNQNLAGEVSGIEFGVPAFSSATRSKITSTTFNADASDLKFLTGAGTDSSIVRMILATSGNVGIATTSPTQALTVTGKLLFSNTDITSRIMLYADDTINSYHGIGQGSSSIQLTVPNSGSHFIAFGNNTGGNFSELMRIQNNGNVGIGTSSPSSRLHLHNSSSSQDVRMYFTDTGTGTSSTDGLAIGKSTLNDAFIWNHENANLLIATNNSERMRIASNGNVGIGTTSPNASLQLANNLANRRIVVWESTNNDHQYYGFGINDSILRYQIDKAGASHVFYAGSSSSTSTELMRIQGNGNIGIGTTSPENKLHVSGSITLDGETSNYSNQVDSGNRTQTYITFRPNGTDNDWAYLRQIGTSNNYLMALDIHDDGNEPGFCIRSVDSTQNPDLVNERFRVQGNGNVGIGTSSPSTKLEVKGVIMVDGGDNASAIIKRRGNPTGVDSSPLILGSCSAVIGETPTDTDYGARILIGGASPADSWGGYINLIAYGSGDNAASNSIVFNRRSAANTVSESMRIDKSGNVGIGTSSPSTKLHVNGDIYLPNNQSLWIAGTANSSEKFRFHYNSGNINGPAMIDFRGGALLIRHDVSTVLSVQTSGNVNITGSLSKGSGSFDIKHPNDENKRLVHSFIEGPRCDLIYRGTVQLTNGTATVNLDTDCVEESDCAMTEGTFESLCRNPVKYLHNNDSFSRIKGSISGNILTITCEDPLSSDTIDWMVVAERNDPHIYSWDRTNENGYLKTEHSS